MMKEVKALVLFGIGVGVVCGFFSGYMLGAFAWKNALARSHQTQLTTQECRKHERIQSQRP